MSAAAWSPCAVYFQAAIIQPIQIQNFDLNFFFGFAYVVYDSTPARQTRSLQIIASLPRLGKTTFDEGEKKNQV